MINIVKIVCLSIIILINVAETNRRRSRQRQELYESEQYSMFRQLKPRIIDERDIKPGDDPWPVPLAYKFDNYQKQKRQSIPRANWYEEQKYSIARRPRSRYFDDTSERPEEGPLQVPPINEYDDYQHFRSQNRPRAFENKVQPYSMAKKDPETRIIGGENARIDDAPWQVALSDDQNGFFCGGAIIAPNAIITAGHCIHVKAGPNQAYEIPNAGVTTYVEFGGVDKTKMPFKLEVLEYFMSPNYIERFITEPPGDVDDIAILRLNDSIVESDTVKIIEVTNEHPNSQVCKIAQVTGWGRCSNEENIKPNFLQISWLRMISRKRCKDAFPQAAPKTNYTCGRCDFSTACSGDSGSPVVIDGKLVGVLSSVVSKRNPNYPVVECEIGMPNYILSTKKMWPWIKRALVHMKRREKPVNHNIRDPSDLRRRSLNYNNMNNMPQNSIQIDMLKSREQFMSNIRPRTIGGPGVTNAPQNRANWQISLVTSRYKTRLEINMEHYCGGALLAKNLAITTGHCVYKDNAYLEPLWIRYDGLHYDELSYAVRVKGVVTPKNVEPKCPKGWFDYDMALLILEDDVYETENVKFIALKDKPVEKDAIGTITGWGTHQSDTITAPYLQMAPIHFIGREKCRNSTRPPIGVKYNCGRISPGSACLSDDGGPITIYEDNMWKLVGLLTRSKKGCDHEFHDAVFIEMTDMIDFIAAMCRFYHLLCAKIA